VLHRHGLLTLVEGELVLDSALSIVAAPGETPGHQILRLRAGGRTLYFLGDLIHHPIEIEQPAVMVDWAQPEATLASRRALAAAALAEDALLTATHIREVGRLRGTPVEVIWEAADGVLAPVLHE
jgi:glyoxylase-like metal-dependent hydrolase (beta-lactamase superfamily II)